MTGMTVHELASQASKIDGGGIFHQSVAEMAQLKAFLGQG